MATSEADADTEKLALGLVAGIAVGLAIGVALGNIALWMGIATAVGIILATAWSRA